MLFQFPRRCAGNISPVFAFYFRLLYGGNMSSILSLNGVEAADLPFEAVFRPVERPEGILLGNGAGLPGKGAVLWLFAVRLGRHTIILATVWIHI